MEAMILCPNRQRIEAVVLSLGPYHMRIVPRHTDDAVELVYRYGHWTDESGVPVEFEALVVDDENDLRIIAEWREIRSAAS